MYILHLISCPVLSCPVLFCPCSFNAPPQERTLINEDLETPTIIPPAHKDDNIPECVKHEITDVLWFEEKMLVTGGPAGKGPDPPEPPPVDQDDSSQYTR